MTVTQTGSEPDFLVMILRLISLYQIVVLVRIVIAWLPIDRRVGWYRLIEGLTEPLLLPLRRHMPPVGLFDVSPLAALLILSIVQELITLLFKFLFTGV
jgi:YggT family protein